MTQTNRCPWVKADNKLYVEYHDHEWGVPVSDDTTLFEFLILEGAQAGLSWETILKRRSGYAAAFSHFDPQQVANYSDQELLSLQDNSGIIRNKLKIQSAIQNARIFVKIQQEFGSFSKYLWEFVNYTPIQNNWAHQSECPTVTPESEAISKDLKSRGMNFVGPTIIYAYMQAMGMVNDHLTSCFCHTKTARLSATLKF